MNLTGRIPWRPTTLTPVEWWGWVTWAVALTSGIGGLVLGVRAELRSDRYSPVWVMHGRVPVRFVNRTGEDAADVRLTVTGGRVTSGSPRRDVVESDQSMDVIIEPEGERFYYEISWTRPRTGKTYVTNESWRQRQLRRLSERSRKAN